jgi:short-subunit dehydrogenase
VILTGRRLALLEATVQELLDETASLETFNAIDADLTKAEGRNKLIHAIDRRLRPLDLAIYATQLGAIGQAETDLRTLFEINVFALIDLTHAIFPLLQAGQSPSLVNFGAIDEPSHPTYPVSHAAVAGFTNLIETEYSKIGIEILLLDQESTTISIEKNSNNSRREANLVFEAIRVACLENASRSRLPLTQLPRLSPRSARKKIRRSLDVKLESNLTTLVCLS